MFCRECGAELIEGSRFCKICGTPVERGAARADAPNEGDAIAEATTSVAPAAAIPGIASAQEALHPVNNAVGTAPINQPANAVSAGTYHAANAVGTGVASTAAKGVAAVSRIGLLVPALAVGTVGAVAVTAAIAFNKPDVPAPDAPSPIEEQAIPEDPAPEPEPEPAPVPEAEPEPEPTPEPEPEPAPASDAQIEAIEAFVEAWYGDWEWSDGSMTIDRRSISERTTPFVAPGSEAYDTFSTDETFSMMGGRVEFIRDAATNPVDVQVQLVEGSTFKVDVSYLATQAYLTQEMYDSMASSPATVTWYVTLDGDNLVTSVSQDALTTDSESEAAASDMPAAYVTVLDAYRTALQSSSAPNDALVNQNAWDVVNWGDDRTKFAYALYDLNGDGTDELLIGIPDSGTTVPGVSETFMKTSYRIYDLYGFSGSTAERVLSREDMGSLGYRGYCVPCEDGKILTGGSGGATVHVWRLYELTESNDGSLALVLKGSIERDEPTITFSNTDWGDVDSSEAGERFAEYTQGYVALEGFDWKPLYG